MTPDAAAAGPPVDVLGDGRLLKELLVAGSGDLPTAGAQVRVHYECKLSGSDEVVDSSYARGETFAFALGRGDVLEGLEKGVRSMRQGEKARLRMHPDLALGAAGCGGGTVAAEATLCCDVELLEASGHAADEDMADELSPEERLQRAMRAKDAGNASFKTKEYDRAAALYEASLSLLGFDVDDPAGSANVGGQHEDLVSWADGVRGEARAKLGLASYLNLAQCELKRECFLSAIFHASAALKLEATSSKAFYRRGLAAMGAGLLDQARSDLLEAARHEPQSAEIRAQLQECQSRLDVTEQKDRSVFGGMFDRAKPSADADAVVDATGGARA